MFWRSMNPSRRNCSKVGGNSFGFSARTRMVQVSLLKSVGFDEDCFCPLRRYGQIANVYNLLAIHVEDEFGLWFCTGARIAVCTIVEDTKLGELGQKFD